MKVFISGSISVKSLNENDLTLLNDIVEQGSEVLIGDAFGVDKLVQEYLYKRNYQNITVYFSGEKIRNNIGKWQTRRIANPDNRTGKSPYQLKDNAMAVDCDSGMMFWDGKSTSTKYNMDNLARLGKVYIVQCNNLS